MFRAAFRPVLAWLLLLCLLRTLLPETWLLAWHPHQHTMHEPRLAARHRPPGELWLTVRHQHCHAEQFYNVPFAAAVCAALPLPRVRVRYQPSGCPGELPTQLGAVRARAGRGPPAA